MGYPSQFILNCLSFFQYALMFFFVTLTFYEGILICLFVCIVFQHNFPRTLEALVLHLLSPVGAEVLTRKFDEIDQQNTEENRYLSIILGVNPDLVVLCYVVTLASLLFFFMVSGTNSTRYSMGFLITNLQQWMLF